MKRLDLFDLDNDSVFRGIVIAALIGTPEGHMLEDDIRTIWDEYSGVILMVTAWELVLVGEMGVSVKDGEVCFHRVPEDDRKRRRDAINGAIRGEKVPPWPK